MSSSTNERQQAKRLDQAKRDRVNDEIITRQLMSSKDGRRWVWLRLAEGQMFQGDESLDPYRMAFEKGRRNAALRLLKDVQAFTPNEYILMANEAQTIEANITKKDPNYVGSQHQLDFGDSGDSADWLNGPSRGEPVS